MGEAIRQFLFGAGSILEMYPEREQLIKRPDFMRAPDSEKIASDWHRVGRHLIGAMKEADREVGSGAPK